MFTARGKAVSPSPDGGYSAVVQFIDDATGFIVAEHSYRITGLPDLKDQVRLQLQLLKDARRDAAIAVKIVGEVIETI
jgi:hypothetical protein